jgi:hypothetical protein
MPSAGDGEAGEPEVIHPSWEETTVPRRTTPILCKGKIKGQAACAGSATKSTPRRAFSATARYVYAYEYKLWVSSWHEIECTGCLGYCATCGAEYPREVIKERTGVRAFHCTDACFLRDDKLATWTPEEYDATRLTPSISLNQGFPLMLWADAIEI